MLSDSEKSALFDLKTKLTGHAADQQQTVIVNNVVARMSANNVSTLDEYLKIVAASDMEMKHFISAITIHTTSWFRECETYSFLLESLNNRRQPLGKKRLRVLSAGCSTGEEVYSVAILLEGIRTTVLDFDYSIEGWDLDPLCVSRCQKGEYQGIPDSQVPEGIRPALAMACIPRNISLKIPNEILSRCKFSVRNLHAEMPLNSEYDLILCRNVLIYFDHARAIKTAKMFIEHLSADGVLCLGTSDTYTSEDLGAAKYGQGSFIKGKSNIKNEQRKKQKNRPLDLILLGASTGGTEVLLNVLRNIPQPCPPVMVVQHISDEFAGSYGDRLATTSKLVRQKVLNNMKLEANHLYFIDDNSTHLGVKFMAGELVVDLSMKGPISGHRPSVDYLFFSAAKLRGHNIAAALFTGMGRDGAAGLLALKELGMNTFAQSQESCVVFGMPGAAIELGAAKFIGSPQQIRSSLEHLIHTHSSRAA